jgi:hypothetical protein
MEIDPKIELHINEKLKEHRQKSDESYAIKLVEKVIFYVISAMGIAVLAAVLRLVVV